MYLDLAEPVGLPELKAAITRLGVDEDWSGSVLQNRWSYLRRAVLHAVSAGCGSIEDVSLYFTLLPQHAPPPDGRSSVNKTLSLLLGRPLHQKRRGHELDKEKWRPMLDILALRGGKSVRLANLELVIRAAGAIEAAPAKMLGAQALCDAADRISMPQPTFRAALATYRDAREALIQQDVKYASQFGAIPRKHSRRRGLHSLSRDILDPILENAGITVDASDMDWVTILAAVAPVLHEEYQAWRALPRRGEQVGSATAGSMYSTGLVLNRFVAGMLVAGRAESLQTMSLLDIFLPTQPPFKNDELVDPLANRARERAGRAADPVLHQPIRVSLDAMEAKARQNARIKSTDVGYTISIIGDVQRLWGLVGGVFRLRMLQADPASWEPYARAFQNTYDLIRAQQLAPSAARNSSLTLDLVSLPQLVCIGMPLLEMERRQARDAWRRAVARVQEAGHDVVEHPVSAKAYREYARAAEIRLAAGIYAVDGLRLSNYRCGLLGEHYQIDFVYDQDGKANGIASVRTQWTGHHDDFARTKRETVSRSRRRATRAPTNRRENPDWAAAYVPRDALWQYLKEVTLPRVIASGGLPNGSTVEELVAARLFPLFVAKPKAEHGKPKLRRMSVTMVGVNLAGYALWRTAKYALGRDLPEWKDLDRSGAFFRALVGHDFRTLSACWWGQVLHEWAYAAWLTNDREDTLKEYYSADIYQRWRELGGNTTHWDHPLAYKEWMVAIREKQLDVVDLQDPALPMPPAARAWLERYDRQARRSRNVASRVKGVRRARSGQAAPRLAQK